MVALFADRMTEYYKNNRDNVAGKKQWDGTLNKNGFPIGKVGRKFKIHLPKKYCEKGNDPVDAVKPAGAAKGLPG